MKLVAAQICQCVFLFFLSNVKCNGKDKKWRTKRCFLEPWLYFLFHGFICFKFIFVSASFNIPFASDMVPPPANTLGRWGLKIEYQLGSVFSAGSYNYYVHWLQRCQGVNRLQEFNRCDFEKGMVWRNIWGASLSFRIF